MSAPPSPPPRVLVIDDEKGLRDMLSYTLRRRGYAVSAVESGEKGVAAARDEEFDAVICDIMMPGMNGVQALELLKRERPATEVIMVTGFPDVETEARVAELGALEYIPKPYELNALCALLDKAVALKRGRAGG